MLTFFEFGLKLLGLPETDEVPSSSSVNTHDNTSVVKDFTLERQHRFNFDLSTSIPSSSNSFNSVCNLYSIKNFNIFWETSEKRIFL